MHSLLDLLVRAAALAPDTELHYYDINGSTKLTYSQLLSRAEASRGVVPTFPVSQVTPRRLIPCHRRMQCSLSSGFAWQQDR